MKAVRMKSQAGFSLIELMIVVAIIGILATIAVPNFNRFTGKAKQSEAKAALSAIYSGEKSFFAEWTTYYGVFKDIGYAPEGKTNYKVGFSGAGTAPGLPFATADATSTFTNAVATFPSVQPTTAYNGATLTGATAPGPGTFIAAASAKFNSAGQQDNWTCNETKTITNTLDGL